MKDTVYIVVNKSGVDRMIKRSNQMVLKPGEKAFELVVDVPDEVFKPAPLPTVKMTVPKEAFIHEINISAEQPSKP